VATFWFFQMVARNGYDGSLSKQKNEEAAAPRYAPGHELFQNGNLQPWFKTLLTRLEQAD
jgi:hypothetical protein